MNDFFSYHFSLISYHLLRPSLLRRRGLSIGLAALMLLTACSAAEDHKAFEASNLRSGKENNEQLSETTLTVNINTAGPDDLQRIPHVGASIAEKIIEHRENKGPFKRPEDLMLILGISDARYRRIRHLIRVE